MARLILTGSFSAILRVLMKWMSNSVYYEKLCIRINFVSKLILKTSIRAMNISKQANYHYYIESYKFLAVFSSQIHPK